MHLRVDKMQFTGLSDYLVVRGKKKVRKLE